MPTIDYFLRQIRARKVIFNDSDLLRLVFNHSYERCIEQGLDPKTNIRHESKKCLLRVLRIADELYDIYDRRIYLNDMGAEDEEEML